MTTKTQKPETSNVDVPAKDEKVSGAYRNQTSFAKALAAASAEHRSVPTAKAALQVMTHLAWRGPTGTVAWHKGTNPTMVAYAKTIGVVPGLAVAEAMDLCLKHVPAHEVTTILTKEVASRK